MRDHCIKREAARERLRQDRREASRVGSYGSNGGHRRHDEEEDHHARSLDVRCVGPMTVRALLRRGTMPGSVHGR